MPREFEDNFEDGYDLFGLYLKQIKCYHELTRKEEVKLVKEGKLNDLALSQVGLAIFFAKKYLYTDLPFPDLVQEANEGLVIASRKFKLSKRVQFNTYAAWWVRQRLRRANENTGRIIRIPSGLHGLIGKYRSVQLDYKQLMKSPPSDEELRLALDWSKLRLKNVKYAANLRDADSLEGILERRDQETDRLRGYSYDDNDFYVGKKFAEEINRMLEELTPEEERVVRIAFGLGNHRERTQKEVASSLGVSVDKVRKTSRNAIEKLQQSVSPKMQDYI